jgi:hypothetical protein
MNPSRHWPPATSSLAHEFEANALFLCTALPLLDLTNQTRQSFWCIWVLIGGGRMRVAIALVLIILVVAGLFFLTAYFPYLFSGFWKFFLDNQFITALVIAYFGYMIELLRRADDAARELETLRSYIYFAVQDRLNKELRLRKNLWQLLFHDEKVTNFVEQHIKSILQSEIEQEPQDTDGEIAKLISGAAPKIEEHLETFRIDWDGGLASEGFVLGLSNVSARERKLVFQYINAYAEYSDRARLTLMKSRSVLREVKESHGAEKAYRLLVDVFQLRQTSAALSVDGIEIIEALSRKESKLRQLRPVGLLDGDGDNDIEPDIRDKFDELRLPPKFKENWLPYIKFST